MNLKTSFLESLETSGPKAGRNSSGPTVFRDLQIYRSTPRRGISPTCLGISSIRLVAYVSHYPFADSPSPPPPYWPEAALGPLVAGTKVLSFCTGATCRFRTRFGSGMAVSMSPDKPCVFVSMRPCVHAVDALRLLVQYHHGGLLFSFLCPVGPPSPGPPERHRLAAGTNTFYLVLTSRRFQQLSSTGSVQHPLLAVIPTCSP